MSNNENQQEDVFLSYAREDQNTAAKIVDLLEKRGFTVFWDIEIRNGTDWRKKLAFKLGGVSSVLVLWSKHSTGSEWVLEEADFGRSRQVLAAVRLDDCKLPFGYRKLHTDNLVEWTGEVPPSGINGVTARIKELVVDTNKPVDRKDKDKILREAQLQTKTEHISVSNHDSDREAVIGVLEDFPESHKSINDAYRELSSAQHAALNSVDERIPGKHYASAASHFGQALMEIGAAQKRPARDGRTVEYFLSMERANSLVFAEQSIDERAKPPIQEAIGIYERLSTDERYKQDVPVHFRLGCALSRESKDEQSLMSAIRKLRKARKTANEHYDATGDTDQLLREGSWVHTEISKQLGLCNYLMSELPGIQPRRRKKYFEDAVQETRAAARSLIESTEDTKLLITFTMLKARGNLIFLLGQKIREGRGTPDDHQEILEMIAHLKEPKVWDIAQNQVNIIDDIAFGATAIGEWETALEEAERNVENFTSLAVPNGLQPDEKAMQARAKEIVFFAKLSIETRQKA